MEAKDLASADQSSAFVQDAVERHLRQRCRQKLYAYGEDQARKLGIRKKTRVVHEFRQECRGH